GLSEAQVLSPVVLRPASRGGVPVVTLGSNPRFVSLSLDANVDPGVERVHYLIRTTEGSVVANGVTPAPVGGSSVLLLVPVSRLERGAQYVAELRNAVDANALIGEYRFT